MPNRFAAFGVHAFTASGALLGWLALRSAWGHDIRTAFLWLAVAVAVDAVDGVIARAVDVKRHAPSIDGARLDDIVDYFTYVIVPLAILWEGRWLGGASGTCAVAAVLIASGLGFSNLSAKTADHFFTGWPSYWNIVALYIAAWGWSQTTATVLLVVLAALVFVPIKYVYPSRTPILMGLTVALGIIWAVQMLLTIWWLPDVPAWLRWSGLVYPAYYTALSLWLSGSSRAMRPVT
ncbi:MAG: CDP-diacylglycerol O-phosphatidyltransferase [Acidobacteria bacterium]|nr:CDP-diacylglycerol O-phosphatidyltransferase [Acidobacteriota bacterium]